MPYTHIDCFSGPGGFCTGLHAAGFETKVAIEYIKSCVDTYSAKLVRLHLEEGRSYKSLTQEYGVSKSAISKWVELFSNECQKKVNADPTALNDADLMKENLRLRKELEEARKENLFLKKAAAFFAKEIG